MNFKRLNELLTLREADEDLTAGVAKIASDLKTGYDSAKGKAETDKNKAEADQKKADKEKAETEKKSTAEKSKGLKNDFNDFLSTFFTKYPDGSDSFEDGLLAKHDSRADLLVLFKALKNVHDTLESERQKLNAGLVKAKLVPKARMDEINAQARKYFANDSSDPPAQLVDFVRSENSFFKRIFKVAGSDEDFTFDDGNFRQFLTDKIKRTDAHRIGDAAQAVNLLLTHMIREFAAMARTVADRGRKLPRNDTE